MRQILLAPDVLLILTDEIDSVDLNTTQLYLYQYGGRQQLLFEDGEVEERTNSFGYIPDTLNGFDKVILSPTPNFYPDTHFAPNFHNDSELSTYMTSLPSSAIDHIKCKLMFSAGFGYQPSLNALQYLSIQYRGTNGITDLVNIIDDYTSSKITASDREIVLNGTIYNSEIEFRLLSIARLQSMTAADAVEINTLLFGTDTPEVLHVEYSNTPSTGIVDFVESAITFKKLVPQITNTNNIPVSFENNDIDIEMSQDDGEITFKMIHTRYILEDYLTATKFNFGGLEYELTLTQYDIVNSVVGTTSLFLKNILAPFNPITHHPTNLNGAVDHIIVDITGRLSSLEGAEIQKISTILITDVTPLQGVAFDVTFEEYNLTTEVIQNITNVQTVFDAPTIVEVEVPVYIQNFSTEEITLYPVKQVIDIVGVYNKQLTNSVEFNREYTKKNTKDASTATVSNPIQNTVPSYTILQIGTKQYKNIEGNILRYAIDEYAHAEGAKGYVIIDPTNTLVVAGSVVNANL